MVHVQWVYSVIKIHDLFESDCARVPNRSLGGHHESGIKKLVVPSGTLTPAQSSLQVEAGVSTMTVIRVSVTSVTASMAAKILLCTVIVYNHRLIRTA